MLNFYLEFDHSGDVLFISGYPNAPRMQGIASLGTQNTNFLKGGGRGHALKSP